MPILAAVLSWLLSILFWLFVARFVLDLAISMNPALRPRGAWLIVVESILTVTDVPLRWVRKVVKPLRLGNLTIDLAWTVVILLISVLQDLVARLG